MLFVRLIVGFHLMWGTQDNLLSWARMLEFRDFLSAAGVPYPLFAAQLSVYAQFLCGLLFVIGLIIRPAALVMIINFIAALIIAHRTGGYEPAAPALMMLFSSIAFLIHGAGRASLDHFRTTRTERHVGAPARLDENGGSMISVYGH